MKMVGYFWGCKQNNPGPAAKLKKIFVCFGNEGGCISLNNPQVLSGPGPFSKQKRINMSHV